MAIGKKCRSRANGGAYGMGLVRSTSFGRKRVALTSADTDSPTSGGYTPSKRPSFDQDSVFPKSLLENLPPEILIRTLCGVDHEDLKRLFFVSKAVREATLFAKQHHFAYNTPRKATAFYSERCFGEFDEAKAPNAPNQFRARRCPLSAKELSGISVALFASDDDEPRPKQKLHQEMDNM